MQIHRESGVSFQRLTLLSPPETARILPIMDHETCHTTSSKAFNTLYDQLELDDSSVEVLRLLVQMITRRSCEQLAM